MARVLFYPSLDSLEGGPVLANSLDPDQLGSEEANLSGSALFAIMWIYNNNLDQVIWLAES